LLTSKPYLTPKAKVLKVLKKAMAADTPVDLEI